MNTFKRNMEYIGLVFFLLLGGYFIFKTGQTMSTCQIILGVLGFLFSTLGGYFILKILIGDRMNKEIDEYNKKYKKASPFVKIDCAQQWLGVVERGLFTASILLNVPYWIPFWLGLRTALKWPTYKTALEGKQLEADEENELNKLKKKLQNYSLIGTGLSVVFGVSGACIALGHIPCF